MRREQSGRLRLAFFSPLPPAPTGIADYTADLLPLLPPEWEIEVFAERQPGASDSGRGPVFSYRQWEERSRNEPFDLNIYQVGNNPVHAYALPFVQQQPGLLVLHDAVLHPSRVAAHIEAVDLPGYRRVADASNAAVGGTLAHLVAAGLGSPSLYWTFPLSEDLVRSSLLTAVHGELLARWLEALVPDAAICAVTHWRAVPQVDAAQVRAWRERVGAGPEDCLIGSFGHLGAAHGIEVALEALAALAQEYAFRAVMVGRADPALGLEQRADALGLQGRIHWTGRVGDVDFAALLRAVDVGLNLRFPTARSSSGTLQQLLQLGVPTAISDLVHLRDLPDAAVLRVPPVSQDAEIEHLRKGLARWLADPEARAGAGRAAAAWASREITPEGMARSYCEAIAAALKRGATA